MSAANRRFMAQNSIRTDMVLVVDTSLGDGLPQFKIPIHNLSNITVQVVGGTIHHFPSVNSQVTIPLDDTFTTIHELRIRAAGGTNTFYLSFNPNNHPGQDLDNHKPIYLKSFGNGNHIGQNEFISCSNLVIETDDTPRMNGNIQGAFWGIKQISAAELERWDFSKTTSLNRLCLNMEIPFQAPLNINAPLLTDVFQAFSGMGDTNNRINHNITINAPLVTTAGQIFQGSRFGPGVKIIMNTPLNTNLHFAFPNIDAPDLDLSEVNVSSVTSNNSWLAQALNTTTADNMLVKWAELPIMQYDVDWNLRGSQITSVGKAAIDDMEFRHGCTFSNYTVL